MNFDRQNIESTLAVDLKKAQEAFNIAKKTFNDATREVPSGTPHPDGAHLLKRSGAAFRSSMEAYAQALSEFNRFIIDGTIPERLRDDATGRRR